MPIHRLLYRSEAALPGSPGDVNRQVAAIIEASHAANTRVGVTGALLFTSGVFIQALEGPLAAVEATFERICGDLRHRRVRLLEFVVAEDRVFGEWAMAEVTPTRELARLYPTLVSTDTGRLDAVTASTAVQTMRALLLADVRPGGLPSMTEGCTKSQSIQNCPDAAPLTTGAAKR